MNYEGNVVLLNLTEESLTKALNCVIKNTKLIKKNFSLASDKIVNIYIDSIYYNIKFEY